MFHPYGSRFVVGYRSRWGISSEAPACEASMRQLRSSGLRALIGALSLVCGIDLGGIDESGASPLDFLFGGPPLASRPAYRLRRRPAPPLTQLDVPLPVPRPHFADDPATKAAAQPPKAPPAKAPEAPPAKPAAVAPAAKSPEGCGAIGQDARRGPASIAAASRASAAFLCRPRNQATCRHCRSRPRHQNPRHARPQMAKPPEAPPKETTPAARAQCAADAAAEARRPRGPAGAWQARRAGGGAERRNHRLHAALAGRRPAMPNAPGVAEGRHRADRRSGRSPTHAAPSSRLCISTM